MISASEMRESHILDLIERYQRSFRMGGWDIRYSPRWTKKWDKDSVGRTRVFEDSRCATMHFAPILTGEKLEHTIIHEMMHLVLWDLHQMLGQTAAKTGPGGEAILDLMAPRIEYVCNAVAHAFTGVTISATDPDKYPEWFS